MDFLSAMRISTSGLNAQRTRMNVVASNLANMNTTRTAEGGPYRKKDVIAMAVNLKDKFGKELNSSLNGNLKEVKVTGIVEDQSAPRKVFDPTHPDANEAGYVAYPNVNLMQEMVNLTSASRSYEANVTAINASKALAMKALELGR